jgi:hypothetical protein
MLTIEPIYGLANRMLALDSAIALARDIGMQVRVRWIGTKDLGCRFTDIFEIGEPIAEVVEGNRLTAFGRVGGRLRKWAGRESDLDFDAYTVRDMRNRRFDWMSLKDMPGFSLASFDRFYRSARPHDALRPIEPIRTLVAQAVARFDNTIGVHIRRGDNAWSRDGSPTGLFIKRMNTAVADDEGTTFFLATDDPSVEAELQAAFPGRIIIHPKRSLDRRTATAIQDAAVDLYSLAATRRILGSHISTFSIVAAEIGGIANDVVQRDGLGEKANRWYRAFDLINLR